MDGYLKAYLLDRYHIDADNLSAYDIRKIVEISVNNKLYCEDDTHHGVYRVYTIKRYTTTTLDVKFDCVYSPSLGVANTVDDLVGVGEVTDSLYV